VRRTRVPDSIPGIPPSLEQLTPAWLADILGRAVEGPLTCLRIGEGFGLDATVARVRWAGGSVVAKWSTAADGHREQAFYEQIAPRLDVPLLRFHGAVHDHGGGHSLLLLEDRTDCEAGDVIAGTTPVRARRLAAQQARWHAAFWTDRTAALREWGEGRDAWIEQVLPTLPGFLDLDLPMSARVRAALESMPDALPGHIRQLAAGPQTLIHGDMHLDNVLFEGDTPVVIDWPGHRRGSPAIDSVRLLVEGLTSEARPRLQDELLALWRSELRARGCTPPDPSDLVSLRSATVWMILATARWYAVDPSPSHPRIAPLRHAVMTRALSLLDNLLDG
jgi:hypothetical protein